MASWVSPPTHATGDVLAVTDWNTVANNETFLYQAPYIRLYSTTTISVANETITQFPLGGTSYSNYGWTTSSNNAVCPLTGIYSFGVKPVFVQASSGASQGYGYLNGTLTVSSSLSPLSSVYYSGCAGSDIVSCTAGSTFGLWAQQNSGGSLTTVAGATGSVLWAFFVGSQ